MKEKSQERSLERYKKVEETWDKLASYVNKKVKRPSTGVSLIDGSDYFREK
jgi:hypothetical protein